MNSTGIDLTVGNCRIGQASDSGLRAVFLDNITIECHSGADSVVAQVVPDNVQSVGV